MTDPQEERDADKSFLDDWSSFETYGFSPAKARNETKRLTWRLDQKESYSDWMIVVTRSSGSYVIVSEGNKKKKKKNKKRKSDGNAMRVREYHVHKTVLSLGPKKSEYFENLFNTNDMAEHQAATSEIEFEDTAADAFPAMLDYMYADKEEPLAIDSENAVALRHLAHYFQIQSLFTEATEFIKADLSGNSEDTAALTFASEAKKFGDERLAQAAIDRCAADFVSIPSKKFVGVAPDLMVQVLGQMRSSGSMPSLNISHFLENVSNDREINDAIFTTITNEEAMPVVDSTVALSLLHSSERFLPAEPSGDALANSKNLKERCVSAMSEDWHLLAKAMELSEENDGHVNAVANLMGKISLEVQNELLKACLVSSKKECDSMKTILGRFSLFDVKAGVYERTMAESAGKLPAHCNNRNLEKFRACQLVPPDEKYCALYYYIYPDS